MTVLVMTYQSLHVVWHQGVTLKVLKIFWTGPSMNPTTGWIGAWLVVTTETDVAAVIEPQMCMPCSMDPRLGSLETELSRWAFHTDCSL